jgi:hypothetical protein
MSIFDTALPYPDDDKPTTFKPPLAQVDYYQTYDRAGNKIHCDPVNMFGVSLGGFPASNGLDNAILVDRIHPEQKNHFDLLSWAADNSGGGIQTIYYDGT